MAKNDEWASSFRKEQQNLASKVGEMHIGTWDPKDADQIPVVEERGPPTEQPKSNGAAPAPTEIEDKAQNAADASLITKLLRSRLRDTTAELEVLRNDVNSPLHSIKSFDSLNLKPELLKGIFAMGFNSPSRIQETALPALLSKPPQNMIAQSQSGTGKTAAFVLTMLSRVDANNRYPQALCLAPTYELALQIGAVVAQMALYMKPQIDVMYGVKGNRQERGTQIEAQIIIGTPGTVLDWVQKFRLFDPKKIRVFVLDEADIMIDTQGHQDQSVRIHRNLDVSNCQMMLFSATYNSRVMQFAQAIIKDPITIKLRKEEESLENIEQYFIRCRSVEDKFRAICNIYATINVGQAIIFCHTRKTAAWLVDKMRAEGNEVALLSGELTVEDRSNVIERFREGQEKVLVTTNVTARGIDIDQVTLVVNFDLPVNQSNEPDCETYLHRIGRTGRFGRKGLAINMVDGEQSMRIMKAIEAHFNRPIKPLDADNLEEVEKIGQ